VSLHSLLPANATGTLVPLSVANVNRVEIHAPAGQADNDWLTVATVGGPIDATAISATNVNGVDLTGNRHRVVLFPSDHAGGTISSAQYSVTQADGDHLIVDVAQGSYAITASAGGGMLSINVAAGGSFSPSANGSLAFHVAQDGTVTK
jgi:hypothetical protein